MEIDVTNVLGRCSTDWADCLELADRFFPETETGGLLTGEQLAAVRADIARTGLDPDDYLAWDDVQATAYFVQCVALAEPGDDNLSRGDDGRFYFYVGI
jgi:hypothetical protein